MHHIFHTEGIILESRNYREADKCYFILTRDHGLVFATAQGVRKISSKLRFVLSDFSHIKLDLVKGREIWRLTSATKTEGLESIAKDPKKIFVFANVARLLKRLVAGEDPNEGLFEEVLKGMNLLDESSSVEEIRTIESVLVLRILHSLGYVGSDQKIESLIRSPFENELVLSAIKDRREVVQKINKILKETQL